MATIPNRNVDGPSDTQPIPPRFWWLKRLVSVALLLIVALSAFSVWLSYEADRRLQAFVDACHELGQPVLMEDFESPSIPDDENAAHFLTRAAAAVVQPSDVRIDARQIVSNPELCAQFTDQVRRLVEANADALKFAHEARSKAQADWGIRLKSPLMNMLLPHLGQQRDLARTQTAASLYYHETGNDAAAIELLRDLLSGANHVGKGPPGLIPHLVRIAISSQVSLGIEEIAPALRVNRTVEQPRDEVARGASRHDVRALIDDLLREDELREGFARAFYFERLQHLDTVESLLSGKLGPGGLSGFRGSTAFGLRSIWRLDAVRAMKELTRCAAAGFAPNLPAARAYQPPELEFNNRAHSMARLMSSFLPVSFHPVRTHFSALTRRRMAATALAIRLHVLDHGQRPPSLDSLVPEYLPAAPMDPFAADGRLLGYLRDAPQPLLYSVGLNGIDDHGAFRLRRGNVDSRESEDIPFFLNGDRPRRPPEFELSNEVSEQDVKGGANEHDVDGNDEQDHAADGKA